jgi:SHAQKYF class myb-like DNA-binding protein
LQKKKKREGTFNTGRWLPDEHHRFIEALLKFGNEWKSVQKHVGTRSSTQARSHAQKFFVKIGKTQIENLSLDFANNSLKSLNQMADKFDNEQMSKAIQILNKIAYDKKSKSSKGDSDQMSELHINLNDHIDYIKVEPLKR